MNPSVLLCVGAGRGTVRPPAGRQILTEIDTALSFELAATHAGGTDLVSVYNLAVIDPVGPDDRTTVPYRTTMPEMSAAHRPTGLLDLFPGMIVSRAEAVAAITPADLVAACHLAPSDTAMLMVDHPADTRMIVGALLECGMLHRFARLWLRTSPVELYEKAGTVEDIRALLHEAGGYGMMMRLNEDPDLPVLEAVLLSDQDAW